MFNNTCHFILLTCLLPPAVLGWLEPLLDRIAANQSNVVAPVIDVIDDKTMQYKFGDAKATNVGGFDWNLQFNWHGIPDREMKRRQSDVDPVRYVAVVLSSCFKVINKFILVKSLADLVGATCNKKISCRKNICSYQWQFTGHIDGAAT